MNQIIEHDQESKAVAISSETTALMSMIERVCLDPNADISKLEKMLDMQERILDRNAKQSFTADLASMQIELPRIAEKGEGHNKAKYALLEDINDAVRPVLNKYGFAVTFSIDQQAAQVTVIARLSHRMGFSEETRLTLPLDTSGSKNAVQAAGSTISYGKRYAICALLNISTGMDTDGNLPSPTLNNTFSKKHEEIKTKRAISNDGLNKSMAKIAAGELTIQRLKAAIEFTAEQLTAVNSWVAGSEWADLEVTQ